MSPLRLTPTCSPSMDDHLRDLTDEERRICLSRVAPCFVRPGYRCGEVGVMHGDFSGVILDRDPGELYLIDSWNRSADVSPMMRGLDGDAIHRQVHDRFADDPRVKIVRGSSPAIAEQFEDDFFDWLYIDADHGWEAVWLDLRAWLPKVKTGGILCGHDYTWPGANGNYAVHQAVESFWPGNAQVMPLAFSNDWVLRKVSD